MNRAILFISFLFIVQSLGAQDNTSKLEQAQAALQEKNYELAHNLYQQAFKGAKENSISGDDYFNAAWAAQKAEQFEKAIDMYDYAISLQTNVAECLQGKCESLIAIGKVDEVKQIDPENIAKWQYKAAVYAYSKEKYDDAATRFAVSISQGYNIENAIIYQYNSLMKAGRVDDAENLITNQVGNLPNSKLSITMANILLKDGVKSYQEGLQALSEAEQQIITGKSHRKDKEYSAQIKLAKTKFKEAYIFAEEALVFDSTNVEIQALSKACQIQLK